MSNDGSQNPQHVATELAWSDAAPATAGRYWYHHPASFEHPVLVRVECDRDGVRVYFPDMPFAVPLRLLAGGRWARPLPGGRPAAP